MPWQPWLGAVPDENGTSFRVWAPRASSLEVRIAGGPTARMRADGDGYYTAFLEGVRPGARYRYRFPDGRERPDPASLLQPEGVHGPSEILDLAGFAPRTRGPQHQLPRLVFCEIHLGTYSREGTADGAARHLRELAEAGYTAVEVMPVAAFPGARNWGYDGVDLFAAHAAYGGPSGLARLVDAAHAQHLSAFLDVVYNHFGPEGNYLGEFGPYLTSRHRTPWGDAVNYDGADSAPVRRFVIENALRWVASAGGGFDGLRLDAVHGIVDDSPVHILRELNEAVQREAAQTGRTIHVIAESDLNEARLVEPVERGGYGLAAAWADDFHHALHVALTGESSGYYEDFAPPVTDPLDALVSALRAGWHYAGTHSKHRGRKHGTKAAHLPGRRFVVAAQNHDQVGNRAGGERLTALTSPGGLRVAAAVTALSPALPLFFQGEEWDAPEPFPYFVSHGDPALVEAVRKGRREEFKAFAWGGEVPDPQDDQTFLRSKIDRAHRDGPAGRAALRWHQELLALRHEHPALQDDRREALEVRRDGAALILRRWNAGKEVAIVALFAEEERDVALPAGRWRVLLDSGAAPYAVAGAKPARLSDASVRLCGRCAVVLERTR
ncbi:MAG TPA: malto-oligosyltrehalose trehalohydrolase [Myxococcales bacterium]|nr:malto-oligosyltrehalose trehalohydrolase [Myxococcales bacterium]